MYNRHPNAIIFVVGRCMPDDWKVTLKRHKVRNNKISDNNNLSAFQD